MIYGLGVMELPGVRLHELCLQLSIGTSVVRMEAHLILVTLVQHVTCALVPGQTIQPEPLLWAGFGW